MGRAGYARGRRQVQVWVSGDLHEVMKGLAVADSVSLQGWMVSAFREKVSRDGGVPDWGAVLAAGRAAKQGRVVEVVVEADPLEEIA